MFIFLLRYVQCLISLLGFRPHGGGGTPTPHPHLSYVSFSLKMSIPDDKNCIKLRENIFKQNV